MALCRAAACSAALRRETPGRGRLAEGGMEEHQKAFVAACRRGSLGTVQSMLAAEARGEQALGAAARNRGAFRAAARGHDHVLQALLELEGEQAVDVNRGREVAFRMACYAGHEAVVALLLALRGERAVDVHEVKGRALTNACTEGHDGVILQLLALPPPRALPVRASQLRLLARSVGNGQGGSVALGALLTAPTCDAGTVRDAGLLDERGAAKWGGTALAHGRGRLLAWRQAVRRGNRK